MSNSVKISKKFYKVIKQIEKDIQKNGITSKTQLDIRQLEDSIFKAHSFNVEIDIVGDTLSLYK